MNEADRTDEPRPIPEAAPPTAVAVAGEQGDPAAALAAAIIAELDTSYDLVYVHHDDGFTAAQIAAIARGDFDSLWASTDEFEFDARENSITSIVRDALNAITARPSQPGALDHRDWVTELTDWSSEHGERVRHAIEERDRGDWPRQLANLSGSVLLRIAIDAVDEDHAWSYQPVTAAQVCQRLNLATDHHNLTTIDDVLDNASPEHSTLMGYWVAGAAVAHLYDLPTDPNAMIDIDEPYLYLGNPFTGSGFLSDQPLHATIQVRRDQIRTDADAFGHSLNNVYGGLNPASFAATLRATPTATRPDPDATIGQQRHTAPSPAAPPPRQEQAG